MEFFLCWESLNECQLYNSSYLLQLLMESQLLIIFSFFQLVRRTLAQDLATNTNLEAVASKWKTVFDDFGKLAAIASA